MHAGFLEVLFFFFLVACILSHSRSLLETQYGVISIKNGQTNRTHLVSSFQVNFPKWGNSISMPKSLLKCKPPKLLWAGTRDRKDWFICHIMYIFGLRVMIPRRYAIEATCTQCIFLVLAFPHMSLSTKMERLLSLPLTRSVLSKVITSTKTEVQKLLRELYNHPHQGCMCAHLDTF